MKKIYYSVEKHTENADYDEYVTGVKTVCVYEIKENELVELVSFNCNNEESSIDLIKEELANEELANVEFILL